MDPEVNVPFTLPPALAARIEQAAQEAGKSPAEMLEGWLERDRKERSWQELVRRGQARGAAVGIPSDEDAAIEFVDEKIAESRRERRER
jgi:hypothetical protein